MQFTAQQIADLLQGVVEGNAAATVSRLSKIEEGGEGSLSFLANPAYAQYVYGTTASVVIIGKDFALTGPVKTTLVRVADAQGAFAKVLELYDQIKRNKKGISPQAVISEGAVHGTDCYIGPLAFIGEHARIGNNVNQIARQANTDMAVSRADLQEVRSLLAQLQDKLNELGGGR